MVKGFFITGFLIALSTLHIGCVTGAPTHTVESNEKLQVQAKILQVEKEKLELELRNTILTQALLEKKNKITKLPKGQIVQPFPQFEELIYDQAKNAFASKDEERLTEAVRILKTNQPSSKFLEPMYFWLAQIQQEKAKYNNALITYNDFLKSYPASTYAPQALYLKGQLYEKLNLKDQALKIFHEVRKKYPHSREKHFADSKIEGFARK